MRRLVLPGLGIVLATLVAPAAGQVFKWVDAKGVVNYGDRPPPTASKAKALDDANARVSVVPGMSREEIERERERGLRRQLEQAQLEIDALRARPTTTTVHVAPPEEYGGTYWGGYGYGVGYPGYPGYPMNRRGHNKDRFGPPYAAQLPVRNGPVKRAGPQPR